MPGCWPGRKSGRRCAQAGRSRIRLPHAAWIDELVGRYGTRLDEAEANRVIRHDIGCKFAEILGHAGVFKRDRAGREACARFLTQAGFKAQG